MDRCTDKHGFIRHPPFPGFYKDWFADIKKIKHSKEKGGH